MKKRKQRRSKNASHRPRTAWPAELVQKDVEAFREWVASGEADKPITAEELQRMLALASRIK